jgi:hypothetical protein
MHTSPQSPAPSWNAASGKFIGLGLVLLIAYLIAGGLDFVPYYVANQRLCDDQPAKPDCLGLSPSQLVTPAPPIIEITSVPAVLEQVDPVTAAPAVSGDTRVVTSVQLNMRASASADTAIIQTLNRGDVVTLVGDSQITDGSTWVLIEANGIKGWVNARFLSEAP